jgi:glycosyltransferase involved in cell wall biosynthesis
LTTVGRRAGRALRRAPALAPLRRWRRARELDAWRDRFASPAIPTRGACEVEIRVVVPPGAEVSLFEGVSPAIRVGAEASDRAEPGCWIYAPDRASGLLSGVQLANLVLLLAHDDLDFAVVSWGTAPPPAARIATPRNNVVFSAAAWQTWVATGRLPTGARGHFVRLPPPPSEATALADVAVEDLGLGPIERCGAQITARGSAAPFGMERRPLRRRILTGSERPILVLPAELAVGGVERNLVAVMRALRDHHTFVVANTEPVSEARDTLHRAVRAEGVTVFEVGELAGAGARMRLLETLAAELQPRLVWICNGSPWLIAHAGALRRCFGDVPIVAQQTYDANEGWIEFYADRDLRSFDRYVAVSEPVRRALTERAGIAPERIDLIPPALDTARFHLAPVDTSGRDDAASRFGVSRGVRRFAQIGRLTAQKRPLDFLGLARRARDAGLAACFVLVGDGELAPQCDAFIARHGLDNVVRIPFCDDPSELLLCLDGLVVASAYEGLPIVVLEALAMGVPVLATDVGGVRALLAETGGGRVVERVGGGATAWRDFASWLGAIDALRAEARVAADVIAQRFAAPVVAKAYERCWSAAVRGFAA